MSSVMAPGGGVPPQRTISVTGVIEMTPNESVIYHTLLCIASDFGLFSRVCVKQYLKLLEVLEESTKKRTFVRKSFIFPGPLYKTSNKRSPKM